MTESDLTDVIERALYKHQNVPPSMLVKHLVRTLMPLVGREETAGVNVEQFADWFYDNGHEFVISDEEDVARAILDSFDVRRRLAPSSQTEEGK